ncbi:hypothetical protein EW146_g8785 [Bondarzewia mesenterica]|uniref:Glucose-methanol-choline oxidoreductase N-terminal domain-containing protein n=1 Tax=Bondarzewia mesenterica TaxID=1095465 RepID=A0A4S4LDC5_9AGAM|nr:hypothetical protein EW146_g8785 [Bondarzewia mesenterica]
MPRLLSALTFCLVTGLLCPLALGEIFSEPEALSKSEWDFVIVGAGTAGSVIANRLSENPAVRVLVIEAGGLNTGPEASVLEVPFLVSAASPNTSYDWNYTTTPQRALNDRSISYPRGSVIGGSSSTNYMAFTRGSIDDYNRLASVTGDEGWSWPHILPYAFKNERHVASADNHNTTAQFNPAWHGSGPLVTSLPGNPTELDPRILATTMELSSEFPFNEEMNSGRPLGIGWLQSTIGHSVRSSSATAFLTPALTDRTNIDLLINTHVTRLSKTGTGPNGYPRFCGVEVARNASARRFTVRARDEVILSAGSIGTPQLLMLSGIGDKYELKKKVGIEPQVHLPEVGKSLQDHPYMTLQWSVNSTKTFDAVVNNQTAFAAALKQYDETGQGIMANNAIANHIGFFRLPNSSDVLREFGDSTAGPLSPHYEFAFCNGFVATTQTPPGTGNYISVAIVLVSPTSRGSVSITSSSAFDHPLIDPALLSTKVDIRTMIEAVKALRRFFSASSWRDYIVAPFVEAVNATTDAGIEAYARQWTASIRHPVATARMSDITTGLGVVHSDLTVKMVSGVRVVDASVLHTSQAMVYIVAERAADLIKVAHGFRT